MIVFHLIYRSIGR